MKKSKSVFIVSLLGASILGVGVLSCFNQARVIREVNSDNSYTLSLNNGVNVNEQSYGVVRSTLGTDFEFSFVEYTPGNGTLGTLQQYGYILNRDPFKTIKSISVTLSSGSLDFYYGWKNYENIEYCASRLDSASTGTKQIDFTSINPFYFKAVATSETNITSMSIVYACNAPVDINNNVRLRIAKPTVGGTGEISASNYVWVCTNIEDVNVWPNYLMTKDSDGSWYYDFSNINVRISGYTFTIGLSDSNTAIRWDYKSNYDTYGLAVGYGQAELNITDLTFEAQPSSDLFTVTFDNNGGTGTMESAEVNGSYELPDCTFTAPDGKTFLSWDVNGVKKAAHQTVTINSNTTVTAVWKYADIVENKVTDLRSDFIIGMDASAVPSLEACGVKYYDDDYNEADVFKILADHGFNYIRVRVWNDPTDGSGHTYGGGACDINNALAIGKRATQYGMKLLVDFHYSDFWADPAKQTAPKAWSDLSLADKKTALYSFTKSSLQTLKDNNVDVGMVQIGNETHQLKMAGETVQANTVALMKEGSKAVREVYSDALVAVHFTDPQKGYYDGYASTLNSNGLDYDVFGTSYYPYWHGTLANLKTTLSNIASTYNKKVMILETSYAYTEEDTDGEGNTIPSEKSYSKPNEISIQGQYDQMIDEINAMKDTTNGIGICYWEGTWISINKGNWSTNHPYWDTYGSGWTTKYAYGYDPDVSDASYSHGCLVDNQAFFDQYGKILPSINAFDVEYSDEKTELLSNGGFESSTSPWTEEIVSGGSSGSDHTFAIKTNTKKEGESSLNIWDAAVVNLRVKQTITNAEACGHTFKASIMGQCTSYTINMYVKENGAVIATTSMTLNGWDDTWANTEFVLNFTNTTSTIEVGFDIDFESAGGWVYLDAASVK